jgi:hypothetical protein
VNIAHLKRRAGSYLWAALAFGGYLPLAYVLNLLMAIWDALRLKNHFESGDLYDAIARDVEYFKRERAALKERA